MNNIENRSTVKTHQNAVQSISKEENSIMSFQLLDSDITPDLFSTRQKQVSLSSVKKKGRRYDDP